MGKYFPNLGGHHLAGPIGGGRHSHADPNRIPDGNIHRPPHFDVPDADAIAASEPDVRPIDSMAEPIGDIAVAGTVEPPQYPSLTPYGRQ